MSQLEKGKPSKQDFQDPMDQPPENSHGQPSEEPVGEYLRDQRVKKGLSFKQVSEMTKIRPSIIEALENELWESLPSPVFAGGFVRSYGRALGLDEEKVMSLFQKSGPTKISAPEPLLKPVKRRMSILFILIFILLTLIPAYFFWKGYAIHEKALISQETTAAKDEKTIDQEKAKDPEIVLPHSAEQPQSESNIVPITEPDSKNTLQADPVPEQDPASGQDGSAVDKPTEIVAPELTLQIRINETTWLRIFVDDRDPEEYIFHPKERFKWKAKKGFELLIGNAGGIDLELNGITIETADKPGQVVHLKLPKGYERNILHN